ncbi:MAG: DUF1800 family protein [Candidatus Binatia bacterium]
MDIPAALAFVRFGLGRRGDEAIPSDPAGWLLSQLQEADPIRTTGHPSSAQGLAALRDDRRANLVFGEGAVRSILEVGVRTQLATALTTSAAFRERLVWFWTNHFTISVRHSPCRAVAAAFVEEAIRPYVTRPFSDMLLAVWRHPAMLLYLSNAESVGPRSLVGRRTGRGLNENLARECLELHTVGPASGYTQTDVTSLAAVLTGWTVSLQDDPLGFRFNPSMHEPGSKLVMGNVLPPGQEGGTAAVRFLGCHPSTYRLLATKLARHFIEDDPKPSSVARIEGVLNDSRGNLGAAAACLVADERAWIAGRKLRTPQDFVLACYRALSVPPEQVGDMNSVLGYLGQPVWQAPTPNGWPDRAAEWAAPEAMMRRVDWAYGFARRVGQQDPVGIAVAVLGKLLRPATYDVMSRAGSRRDALTLMLCSPEFHWR